MQNGKQTQKPGDDLELIDDDANPAYILQDTCENNARQKTKTAPAPENQPNFGIKNQSTLSIEKDIGAVPDDSEDSATSSRLNQTYTFQASKILSNDDGDLSETQAELELIE